MSYHHVNLDSYGSNSTETLCKNLNKNALYYDTNVIGSSNSHWTQDGESKPADTDKLPPVFAVGATYTCRYDIRIAASGASIQSYEVASGTSGCTVSDVKITSSRYLYFSFTPNTSGYVYVDIHTFSGANKTGTQYNDCFGFGVANTSCTISISLNSGTYDTTKVKTTTLKAAKELTGIAPTYGNAYFYLSSSTFGLSRTNCTFNSWNSGSTGAGTAYTNNAYTAVSSTTYVYAVWNTSVTISKSGSGSVSSSSVTAIVGTNISSTTSISKGTANIGGTTVTATPSNTTTKFTGWTNASGTVTPAKEITANFASRAQYTITVQSNNTTYGTVSPTSLTSYEGDYLVPAGNVLKVYTDNTATTLRTSSTATTRADKYRFVEWSAWAGTITGNETVTATFDYPTYTVTIYAGTGGTIRKSSESSGSGSSSKTISGVEYNTYWYISGNQIVFNNNVGTYVADVNSGYGFESWATASTSGYIVSNTSFTATFVDLRMSFTVYNSDYNNGYTLGGYYFYSYSGGTIYTDSSYSTAVSTGSSNKFTSSKTFYAIRNSASSNLTVDIDWASNGSTTESPYYLVSNTNGMYNSSTGSQGDSVTVNNGNYIYACDSSITYGVVIVYLSSSGGDIIGTQTATGNYSSVTFNMYTDSQVSRPSDKIHYQVNRWVNRSSTSTYYSPGATVSMSYGKYYYYATWTRKYYTWTFTTTGGILTYNGTDYTSAFQVSVASGMTVSTMDGGDRTLCFTDTIQSLSAIYVYASAANNQYVLPVTWENKTSTVTDSRTVNAKLTQNYVTLHFSVADITDPATSNPITPATVNVSTAQVMPNTQYMISTDPYSITSGIGEIWIGNSSPYTKIILTANPDHPYCQFVNWTNGSTAYATSGIIDNTKTTWEAHYDIVTPTQLVVTPSSTVSVLRGGSKTFNIVAYSTSYAPAYPAVTWTIPTGSNLLDSTATVETSTSITIKARSDLSATDNYRVVIRATSVADSNVYVDITVNILTYQLYYMTYQYTLGQSGTLKAQQAYINLVSEGRGEQLSGWENTAVSDTDAVNIANEGPLLLNNTAYSASLDLSSLSYGEQMPLPSSISLSDITIIPYSSSCTITNASISGTILSFTLTPSVSGNIGFRVDIACTTSQNETYTLKYEFYIISTSSYITITYNKNSENASFVSGYSSVIHVPIDTRTEGATTRDYGCHIIRPYDSVYWTPYTNMYWLSDGVAYEEDALVTIGANKTFSATWQIVYNLTVQSSANGSLYDELESTSGTMFSLSDVPSTAQYAINNSGLLEIFTTVDDSTIYYGRFSPVPEAGYQLSGWTVSSGGGSSGSLSQNMVFTANFALQTSTFRVMYTAPQGTDPATIPATQSYTGAVTEYTFTVSTVVPVKTGSTFSYWQDSDGNIYVGGQSVTVSASSGGGTVFSKVLTAVFGGSITVNFSILDGYEGTPVASSVYPTSMVLDTPTLSSFPIPVMLPGKVYNGWNHYVGNLLVKVTTSTILTDDETLYIDASDEDTCGATFTFARKENGIVKSVTYHLPMVQSIEDTTNVNLTEISTIVYGTENRFVMDTGTSQKYVLDVIRTTPSGWSSSTDDTEEDLHNYYWGSTDGSGNSFDDRLVSNALWIKLFKQDLDMWQNFGVDTTTGAKTGGFRFTYISGDTTLYPVVDKNVFLTGALNIKYQYGKLALSIPLQVARMIATGSSPNERILTLRQSSTQGETREMHYPDGAHILIPMAPTEWQTDSGSKLFKNWVVSGTSNALYPGDPYTMNDDLTLVASWQEPDGIFAIVNGDIHSYNQDTAFIYRDDMISPVYDNTIVIAYALGGGGGGAGYTTGYLPVETIGNEAVTAYISGGGGGAGALRSQKFILNSTDRISWEIGAGGSRGKNAYGPDNPSGVYPSNGGNGGKTKISVSNRYIELVANGGAGGSVGGQGQYESTDVMARKKFIGGTGGRTVNSGGQGGSCTSEVPWITYPQINNTPTDGSDGSGPTYDTTDVGPGAGGPTYIKTEYYSPASANIYTVFTGGGGGAASDFDMILPLNYQTSARYRSKGGDGGYYTGDNSKTPCGDGLIGGGGGSGPCGHTVGAGIDPRDVGQGGAGAIVLIFYNDAIHTTYTATFNMTVSGLSGSSNYINVYDAGGTFVGILRSISDSTATRTLSSLPSGTYSLSRNGRSTSTFSISPSTFTINNSDVTVNITVTGT